MASPVDKSGLSGEIVVSISPPVLEGQVPTSPELQSNSDNTCTQSDASSQQTSLETQDDTIYTTSASEPPSQESTSESIHIEEIATNNSVLLSVEQALLPPDPHTKPAVELVGAQPSAPNILTEELSTLHNKNTELQLPPQSPPPSATLENQPPDSLNGSSTSLATGRGDDLGQPTLTGPPAIEHESLGPETTTSLAAEQPDESGIYGENFDFDRFLSQEDSDPLLDLSDIPDYGEAQHFDLNEDPFGMDYPTARQQSDNGTTQSKTASPSDENLGPMTMDPITSQWSSSLGIDYPQHTSSTHKDHAPSQSFPNVVDSLSVTNTRVPEIKTEETSEFSRSSLYRVTQHPAAGSRKAFESIDLTKDDDESAPAPKPTGFKQPDIVHIIDDDDEDDVGDELSLFLEQEEPFQAPNRSHKASNTPDGMSEARGIPLPKPSKDLSRRPQVTTQGLPHHFQASKPVSKARMDMEDDEVDEVYMNNDLGDDLDNDDDYKPSTSRKRKRKPKGSHKSKGQKKSRKGSGPRAKTAREWHKKDRLKNPDKVKSETWKMDEIARIKSRIANPSESTFDPAILFAAAPDKSIGSAMGENFNVQDSGRVNKNAAFQNFVRENKDRNDIKKLKKTYKDIMAMTRTFGYGRVTAAGMRWHMAGMSLTTTLLPHQLIGVTHMVARECGVHAPLGSINADDMGLGKTVQALAVCAANPPTDKLIKKQQGTTLIVCLSKLMCQWHQETLRHGGKDGDNITIFESGLITTTETSLTNHFIVFTTYHELMKSHPHPDEETISAWKEKANAMKKKKQVFDMHEAFKEWARDHQKDRGLLHRIHWYRVILDEGHEIKNHLSRRSLAAVALNYHHPHILSGTPIMNSLGEFYPHLLFLREPITSKLSFEEFCKKFCNPRDPTCTLSLGCILSDLIIHRKMDDKFLGGPIVKLPGFEKKIRLIGPHPAERLLISAVEMRFKQLTTMSFGPEDERKKLRHRFSQLTRQRQLTANPDLIGYQIMLIFEVHELEDLRARIEKMMIKNDPRALPNMLYTRLGSWIASKNNGEFQEMQKAAGGGGDDLVYCDACEQPSEDLHQFRCKHKLCEDCFHRCIAVAEEDDDSAKCPVRKCGKKTKLANIKPPTAAANPKESRINSRGSKSRARKRNLAGKDANGIRPNPDPHQYYIRDWLDKLDDGDLEIIPSSKLVGAIEQINYWLKMKQYDKIIVFSQFKQFQILLGIMLCREGIEFLYFSGTMSAVSRQKALNTFQNSPNAKVLLAGLQVGGVGLNLNFACRVISTDPWWNASIDNQAFGRVRRIGQQNFMFFKKIVLAETIDTKLLYIQDKKERNISQIMQDEAPTLSTEEWNNLLYPKKDKTWKEILNNPDLEREEIIDEGIEDDFEPMEQDAPPAPIETAADVESSDSSNSDEGSGSNDDSDSN